MSEETILVNNFFKNYCFSNKTIICHHLSIETDTLNNLLNGSKELTETQLSNINKLKLLLKYNNEVEALESIIFDLTMVNQFYEQS